MFVLTTLCSGDPIHTDSLKLFIKRFGFHGDPLDVALRRLLMDVGLPRETQQIDRVIEAFANRYLSCNPDLFTSRGVPSLTYQTCKLTMIMTTMILHSDHPYILAFSLIMLHTDAFNKSNRRKMSKVDYLRNTTLPGLIPEVLDVRKIMPASQWGIHDGPSVLLRQHCFCTVYLYRRPLRPRRER